MGQQTMTEGVNYESQTLAAAYQDRKAWEQLSNYAEHGDFSERGKIVWEAISAYYQRDENADHCSRQELDGQISLKVKRSEHRQLFSDIIRSIDSDDVSPPNAVAYLLGLKRENTALALASALAAGAKPEKTQPLLERYANLSQEESLDKTDLDVLQDVPLESVFSTRYDAENLIQVYPPALSERIGGGLLKGHHAILYARPDCGKTLFALNAAYGFLIQGFKVLYCSNEEPAADIQARLIRRCTNLPKEEVAKDFDQATAIAHEAGYKNFLLKTMEPGSPALISSLVEKHKPDVVIVDQLRNLEVVEDNRTQQLEKIAQSLRTIAQKHQVLMLSVTQAGASAEGKGILSMSDVDSSNTGIQGACDVMIGVGMTQEDDEIGRRVVSLAKNKFGRHDSFPVFVNYETGDVRDRL